MKRKLLPSMGAASPSKQGTLPNSFRYHSLHRQSPSMYTNSRTSPSPVSSRIMPPPSGSRSPPPGGIPVSRPNSSVFSSSPTQSESSVAASMSSVPSRGSAAMSSSVESNISCSVPDKPIVPRSTSYSIGCEEDRRQQQLRQQQQQQQQQQTVYTHQRMHSAMPNLSDSDKQATDSRQTVTPTATTAPTTPSTSTSTSSRTESSQPSQQQQQQQSEDQPRLGSFLEMLRSKSGTVGSSQGYGQDFGNIGKRH